MINQNINIYSVTVTYVNRFHLLKQVIDSALNEGVAKIIVVDNNSETESRKKLKAYEQDLVSIVMEKYYKLVINICFNKSSYEIVKRDKL